MDVYVVIYPVDSVIHLLNNPGQKKWKLCPSTQPSIT